ncbi:MAG: hypothetical protein K0S71_2788 [Clostridia bacterium]|jgi:spore coat protein JB|nr:hypothetical protein [Clostridia bacterium]
MNRNERDELLNYIYTASFALDDTILYLDTHPTDKDALDFYQKCRAIRMQAMKEYETHFGPLTEEGVKATNKWTWIEDPWPWEMGR